MLSLSLIALDATVLATAVPTIVGELGDFALFPWLFSGYLLAQAVTTPLYAKLSDVYGRKPVILGGIGLFLLGSILCAVASSMPALIIARTVQGIGAGAVQPMSVTIVADIYSLAERAKVQGYVASVSAVASVIGPTLGGLFAEMGIWRGIFVLNVPLCLLAAWMMVRRFHENTDTRPRSVDYPSAVLLTLGLTLLVLAILGGGQTWEWDSPASFAAFGSGVVLLAAFVFAARRAAEPILPGFVLTRRLLLTTTLAGLAVGAILIGLTSFVPMYLEGSLGVSPLVAGLALTTLTIGSPADWSAQTALTCGLGFRKRCTAVGRPSFLLRRRLTDGPSSPTANMAAVAVLCFNVARFRARPARAVPTRSPHHVEWGLG